MAETIDHATSLTNQLITFVRRQPLRPEHFDVVDRILAIRALMETTLGDHIALKLHLAPDLTQVDTDRHQFETALVNLVVNARDALLRGEQKIERACVTISASTGKRYSVHPGASAGQRRLCPRSRWRITARVSTRVSSPKFSSPSSRPRSALKGRDLGFRRSIIS